MVKGDTGTLSLDVRTSVDKGVSTFVLWVYVCQKEMPEEWVIFLFFFCILLSCTSFVSFGFLKVASYSSRWIFDCCSFL